MSSTTAVQRSAGTFSPTSYAGQEVFKLLDGASHLSFENMNFQDVNAAFRFGGKIEDISLQHMTADNINRFVYNLASGTATDATVSGLVIRDVDVTGFAKAVVSLRYDNWKAVFAQQRATGTLLVWSEPFTKTRIPWLFNLRTDPYERSTITSNTYWDWYFDHVYLLIPMQGFVGEFLATFKEFPPRQKAASFTIDQVMASLSQPAAGAG